MDFGDHDAIADSWRVYLRTLVCRMPRDTQLTFLSLRRGDREGRKG